MNKMTKRFLSAFLAVATTIVMAVPTFAQPMPAKNDSGAKQSSAVSDGPKIETSLQNGVTIKGSVKNFDVFATGANGKKISDSSVNVTLNGTVVNHTWDDSTKTSYTLHLAVGTNTVVVSAADTDGKTAQVSYTIYHTAVKDGDVTGKVAISIETFTISNGYLVQPVEIEVHEGEKASQVLDRVLMQSGFKYKYTGALTKGFYLSAIEDGGSSLGFGEGGCSDPATGKKLNITNPSLPPVLAPHISRFRASKFKGYSLGEFDFTTGSGWMYSVNNSFPNYGFADCYLNDGDVVRVQYTLAYGDDIGGGYATGNSNSNYYDIADKDKLTALVAEINSAPDKSIILAKSDIKSSYDEAISILENLSPGQSTVDNIYNILKAEFDSEQLQRSQSLSDAIKAIADLPDINNITSQNISTVETQTKNARALVKTAEIMGYSDSEITGYDKLPIVEAKEAEIDEKIAVVSADSSALTFDAIKGANITPNDIISNLTLPNKGASGSTITWTSSPNGYIGADGAVIRPVDSNVPVMLTATVQNGSESKQVNFQLKVSHPTDVLLENGNHNAKVEIPDDVLQSMENKYDSTNVKFTATGASDSNISSIKETVKSDEKVLAAYDFGLQVGNISKIELAVPVKVTLNLTDDMVDSLKGATNPAVYYYNQNGKNERVSDAVFDLANKTVSFSAPHFSTYFISYEPSAGTVSPINQGNTLVNTPAQTNTASQSQIGNHPASNISQTGNRATVETNPDTGDKTIILLPVLLLLCVLVISFAGNRRRKEK